MHFPKEVGYGYLRFEGKMQKKSGIMKSGLDAMPLFLLEDLLTKTVKVTKDAENLMSEQ